MVSSEVAASGPRKSSGTALPSAAAAADVENADRAVGAFDGEAAGRKGDIVLGGFQHMGGDLLALLDDRVGGVAHDDAGKPHRARGMRAAAFLDDVGVALVDVDVVERHAEPFRHALRERGLVALPAGQRADHDVDPALRMHGDVGALARIAAGGFEVTAKPDAAQPLALARLGAALLESLPIAELHRAIHHRAIGAVVVGDALRVLVGKRRRRNEIAPAQRDAIEAVLLRGFVDQPLDDVNDFRPAGAAIGRRAHRGRQHGARADVRDRECDSRTSPARRP